MNRLLHGLTRRRGLSRRRAGVGAHLLWVRKLVARYRRVARRRSLVGLILAYHRTAGGDGATRPPGATQLQLTIRRLISLAAPVSTASVRAPGASRIASAARTASWAPRRAMPRAGALSARLTVFASEPGRIVGGPARVTAPPAPAMVPHRVLREVAAVPRRITTFPSRHGGRADQPPQITTPAAPRSAPRRVRPTATAPIRIAVFPGRPRGVVEQPAQVTRSSVIRSVVIRLPHVTQLTQANTASAAGVITAAHNEPLLVTHQHIMQRVVSRGLRIESLPSRLSRPTRQPTSPGVVGRASRPSPESTNPRVVGQPSRSGLEPADAGVARRPVYALPQAGLSPQSRPATDTDRQSSASSGHDPSRPGWGVVGPEHAQVDIERLADKVVGRINDRMIAHRERLGRI